MRRFTMLVLIQLAAAAPLAAQFEGTLAMKVVAGGQAGDVNMKMLVKGDQQATILTLPENGGPMAGVEMRMVYDPKTMIATSLLPVPAALAQSPMFANAKGIRFDIDLGKAAANPNTGESVEVKSLGTKQKIAGYDCEDYEITSSKGEPVRACIAQNLGHFLFPSMGGPMGRGPTGAPGWTKVFGTKPGFPLKVWSPNGGGVQMEVTSVERGSVPADMFQIPEGYIDMGGMMGRRGGGAF